MMMTVPFVWFALTPHLRHARAYRAAIEFPHAREKAAPPFMYR